MFIYDLFIKLQHDALTSNFVPSDFSLRSKGRLKLSVFVSSCF